MNRMKTVDDVLRCMRRIMIMGLLYAGPFVIFSCNSEENEKPTRRLASSEHAEVVERRISAEASSPSGLPGRVRTVAEGDALVADPAYQAARNDRRVQERMRAREFAGSFGMSVSQQLEFLRIVDDFIEARLLLIDHERRNRGKTGVEIRALLRSGDDISEEVLSRANPKRMRGALVEALGDQLATAYFAFLKPKD
jgi:hypothetical protein